MATETKTKGLVLALTSASDYHIEDGTGRHYGVDEAKALWRAGKVADYNLAFWRLVTHGFDVEAVKRHDQEGRR